MVSRPERLKRHVVLVRHCHSTREPPREPACHAAYQGTSQRPAPLSSRAWPRSCTGARARAHRAAIPALVSVRRISTSHSVLIVCTDSVCRVLKNAASVPSLYGVRAQPLVIGGNRTTGMINGGGTLPSVRRARVYVSCPVECPVLLRLRLVRELVFSYRIGCESLVGASLGLLEKYMYK
jgi:hypothetical protein